MKLIDEKEGKQDLRLVSNSFQNDHSIMDIPEQLGELFFKSILKLHSDQSHDYDKKCRGLHQLFTKLFIELTKKEQLQFNTLFARVAYVGHKYDLPNKLQYFIHQFRKSNAASSAQKKEKDYLFGLRVLSDTLAYIFKIGIPATLLTVLPEEDSEPKRSSNIQSFKRQARVIALKDDPLKEQLIVRDEAEGFGNIRVQYNIVDRNEPFNKSINLIREVFGFPVTLNLYDIEVDEHGVYRPKGFVIEPDYLIDISTVAECFKDFGNVADLVLLKKFLPFDYSPALMIGNIANYFLDELMTDSSKTFKALFPNVFKLNPLAFLVFENMEVRKIMNLSQKHFVNLKKVIEKDLPNRGIEVEDCFLEPSFYSEKYGIQGRLDVFYNSEKQARSAAIIELKSGKAFKPNVHGLSANHYAQTLLYDLLIKSVYQGQLNTENFILYSGHDHDHLKFAPVVKAKQNEAILLRNDLLGIEWQLMQLDDPKNEAHLLDVFTKQAHPLFKGFLKRDQDLFAKIYKGLSALVKSYFTSFVAFIAREHQIAKTGIHGSARANGLASLWRDKIEDKINNYNIISHLQLLANHSKAEDPILIFNKTESTQPLANFRKGDIAVLYPYRANTIGALHEQIFKCTIIEINSDQVHVRLRSKQFNPKIFEQKLLWNLEHDLLDSGFTAMYRNLFQFIQYPDAKKDLLLTKRAPSQGTLKAANASEEMTAEQKKIFRSIISAEEYFLLWGPPGTGKTSIMLKHLVAHLMNHTNENILLLAYTNRAVDEICEAIERIGEHMHMAYLRIGSRYSTHSKFHKNLLSKKMDGVKTRNDLKSILDEHRIFVSTVASINSKPELIKIKQFHSVIIDEASQILEPMLVGLLPRFQKFILIGDHKQLPAVVTQSKERSAVKDPQLQQLGVQNMRNSLFERMFKKCVSEKWDWAYAQLSHQGRMHKELMEFPNKYFYENTLNILPDEKTACEKQKASLKMNSRKDCEDLTHQLTQKRVLFINTPSDVQSTNGKTNQHEAKAIVKMLNSFQDLYNHNAYQMNQDSIGIITPYRAQIAKISQLLEEENIDQNQITIDTVERYQGGARDIIIISLCTNDFAQLDSMVSLSDEGVDRKLNVALTRAREQVIVLGNKDILRGHQVYEQFISWIEERNGLLNIDFES